MSIDTAAPRTRRAVIAGAVGGLLATVAGLAKAPSAHAGVDGDLVLEATNTTDAQTELVADTPAAGLRVLGTGIGLQGWGDIGVDAYGETIGVNAISDGTSAPAVVAWNRGNSVGQFGMSTDGNDSPPSMPPKTGVFGLAEQDAGARGVFGKTAAGQGVRGEAGTGVGVLGYSESSAGVVGMGPLAFVPDPLGVKPGVYGSANLEPGVFGYSTQGYGVRGDGTTSDGVFGQANANPDGTDAHPAHSPGAGVHGHGGQAGVLGTADDGSFAMQALSTDLPALHAKNASETWASILAEAGSSTAIHGHAGGGTVPNSLPDTALLATAAGSASGIVAAASSGIGIHGESALGNGIRGRGQVDGVIGESPGNRSGVVGFSGGGDAPAGPAKTGVYGEASHDANARGVTGKSTAGQGVRGEATTGIGVEAVATTGLALDVNGRAQFSRSGRASVPANSKNVDVTVPGGLSASANVLATLQIKRGNVTVIAARPNYPTAGKVRIYLSGVASTTASTPVAWFVLG
jgi:hypothetical protein